MADSQNRQTGLRPDIQLEPEVADKGEASTAGVDEEFQLVEQSLLESPPNTNTKTSVLSTSGSKAMTSDMVGALIEESTSTTRYEPTATTPPWKGTPIPFMEAFPGIRPSTPSPFHNVVYLDTPSPHTPDQRARSRALNSEESRSEALAATVLSRAYSTVLASANQPIGHQSSPSLRHVVLSRTTSSSGVSSSNHDPGTTNSSADSFVDLCGSEDSPRINNGRPPTSLEGSEELVEQEDGEDVSVQLAENEGGIATIKAIATKQRNRIANSSQDSSSLFGERKRTASSTAARSSSAQACSISEMDSGSSWSPGMRDSPEHLENKSTENLAQSYDSSEDPNNLKYWWEAGIRDGDSTGTPPRAEATSSHSAAASIDEIEMTSASNPSLNVATRVAVAIENPTESEHLWDLTQERCMALDPAESFGNATYGELQGSTSASDVEMGRELQQSLSEKVLRERKSSRRSGTMQIVVDDGVEYSLVTDARDGKAILEPAELLLQRQSNSGFREWNSELHTEGVTSGHKSLSSSRTSTSSHKLSPSSTANRVGVGILSPEKRVVSKSVPRASPSTGVDPSDLRLSHGLQAWDPVINGTYVTFKFLLIMLANAMRCYPHELPSHPIVHIIAKFSMVPEVALRYLFGKELSYAIVSEEHITRHELYMWYKQIFRGNPSTTPGTFQAIVSSLIQVGLELPLEPMECTLSSLQSNPEVVCLLPPGDCRAHREIDLDGFEIEERPQTPRGSRPFAKENDHDSIIAQASSEFLQGQDTFAYNIRDDLELSSSSGSDTPWTIHNLSRTSNSARLLAEAVTSNPTARRASLTRLGHAASNEEYVAGASSSFGVQEKGKGKMRVVEMQATVGKQEEEKIEFEHIVDQAAGPAAIVLSPDSSSSVNSVTHGLMFSDSKWNVFNRVIGLVSHTLQIPWREVLEDPRVVYPLQHDARVSVDTFQQWMMNAKGEEAAERELARTNSQRPSWKAITDAEGHWSGQSVLSAMFAILPPHYGVTQVSQLAPFQRALLHLVRVCDYDLMQRPIEDTLACLRTFDRFLPYKPWSLGRAAQQAIQNLKSHLESPFASYLAPEARNELKEFVRVQEYQIGSSNKDWEGQEALDALTTARVMMDN